MAAGAEEIVAAVKEDQEANGVISHCHIWKEKIAIGAKMIRAGINGIVVG